MVSDQEVSGGAAVAATRLAQGLERIGHEVVRVTLGPAPTPTTGLRVVPGLAERSRARRAADRLAYMAGVGTAHVERMGAALRSAVRDQGAAAVNVHNVHGGVAGGQWPHDVVRWLGEFPLVWTLHDMWSFTGRCAYAGSCRRFEARCTAECPTPGEYPALAAEAVGAAFDAKAGALRGIPGAVAACPSRWLAAEAARSAAWRGRRVETIPYGLPLDVFRPLDRRAAKRVLELPEERGVVLVVAENLDDRRKGLDLLVEAWERLGPEAPVTLLMGRRGRLEAALSGAGGGAEVRSLGFIGDDLTKAIVYSGADALVHPAREDNLPNVVLEAMACGTPTVAFDVGGLPDMVRRGETGWLAGRPGGEGLARAVREASGAGFGGEAMRRRCREVAEAEYRLELQAERYAELFREVGS